MSRTSAFEGLQCRACARSVAADFGGLHCPDCGGHLRATYDLDRVDGVAGSAPSRAATDRFAPLLPVQVDAADALAVGGTPLVACPSLASDLGVASVQIKDEGRNPTGSVTDRGLAVAVAAAAEAVNAETVWLPTTGHGGQSAAAYAGRHGLASHSFVPSRSSFSTKAMVNVHGGDMRVVEGRYPDARAAAEEAAADADDGWFPVGPASPYRVEGLKTLFYEAVLDASDGVPDAIVLPVAHGLAPVAAERAFAELRALDHLDTPPRLYAAQPAACAPIVDALDRGVDTVEAWTRPDTIAGALEVPDPAWGAAAVDAVRSHGGTGVAVEDDDLLAAAVEATAETGLEIGATGGTAVAALSDVVGDLDVDAQVTVVNPLAGALESDLLRSHLMRHGE